ncbi:DUF2567 domain-containing protein [Micromonospora sp. DT31]|uniref:DUF2567 domain-containing protein n=1 Tax=Micromonospora sp. DT31 TaxID=3393434 RepID=UPI003CF6106B
MSPETPDPERAADADARPPYAPPPAGPAGFPAPTGDPTAGPGIGPYPPHPGPYPAPPGPYPAHPGPYPPHPGGVAWAPAVPRAPRRPGQAFGRFLGVAALLTLLGVPLGLLWAWLAPETPVRQTANGAVYTTPQPEQPIAADGWFSLLTFAFGVLAAVALWVLLRRWRGPTVLLGGALGALGAAVVAWQVGRRIGLSTFQRLLETAPPGAAFTKPVDLRAGGVDWYGLLPVPHGSLLLAAFGTAVTYTLLAGWSRWPSLRPEPVSDGGWPPPPPDISSAPADQPVR